MRTGILGGTFDPIHVAHLHAGETALHEARLDRVLFMPTGDPWQKSDRLVTPAVHRLAMVRLGTESVDGFEVDDRELHRAGPTYTIDTLATFPDDEEIVLVVGADAALTLPTWHRHVEVLARVTLLVAPRPGVNSGEVAELIPDAVFLDMAMLDVSGTEIREMARAGIPYRFLVTDPVFEYIEANGLYAKDLQADMVGDPTDLEGSP